MRPKYNKFTKPSTGPPIQIFYPVVEGIDKAIKCFNYYEANHCININLTNPTYVELYKQLSKELNVKKDKIIEILDRNMQFVSNNDRSAPISPVYFIISSKYTFTYMYSNASFSEFIKDTFDTQFDDYQTFIKSQIAHKHEVESSCFIYKYKNELHHIKNKFSPEDKQIYIATPIIIKLENRSKNIKAGKIEFISYDYLDLKTLLHQISGQVHTDASQIHLEIKNETKYNFNSKLHDLISNGRHPGNTIEGSVNRIIIINYEGTEFSITDRDTKIETIEELKDFLLLNKKITNNDCCCYGDGKMLKEDERIINLQLIKPLLISRSLIVHVKYVSNESDDIPFVFELSTDTKTIREYIVNYFKKADSKLQIAGLPEHKTFKDLIGKRIDVTYEATSSGLIELKFIYNNETFTLSVSSNHMVKELKNSKFNPSDVYFTTNNIVIPEEFSASDVQRFNQTGDPIEVDDKANFVYYVIVPGLKSKTPIYPTLPIDHFYERMSKYLKVNPNISHIFYQNNDKIQEIKRDEVIMFRKESCFVIIAENHFVPFTFKSLDNQIDRKYSLNLPLDQIRLDISEKEKCYPKEVSIMYKNIELHESLIYESVLKYQIYNPEDFIFEYRIVPSQQIEYTFKIFDFSFRYSFNPNTPFAKAKEALHMFIKLPQGQKMRLEDAFSSQYNDNSCFNDYQITSESVITIRGMGFNLEEVGNDIRVCFKILTSDNQKAHIIVAGLYETVANVIQELKRKTKNERSMELLINGQGIKNENLIMASIQNCDMSKPLQASVTGDVSNLLLSFSQSYQDNGNEKFNDKIIHSKASETIENNDLNQFVVNSDLIFVAPEGEMTLAYKSNRKLIDYAKDIAHQFHYFHHSIIKFYIGKKHINEKLAISLIEPKIAPGTRIHIQKQPPKFEFIIDFNVEFMRFEETETIAKVKEGLKQNPKLDLPEKFALSLTIFDEDEECDDISIIPNEMKLNSLVFDEDLTIQIYPSELFYFKYDEKENFGTGIDLPHCMTIKQVKNKLMKEKYKGENIETLCILCLNNTTNELEIKNDNEILIECYNPLEAFLVQTKQIKRLYYLFKFEDQMIQLQQPEGAKYKDVKNEISEKLNTLVDKIIFTYDGKVCDDDEEINHPGTTYLSIKPDVYHFIITGSIEQEIDIELSQFTFVRDVKTKLISQFNLKIPPSAIIITKNDENLKDDENLGDINSNINVVIPASNPRVYYFSVPGETPFTIEFDPSYTIGEVISYLAEVTYNGIDEDDVTLMFASKTLKNAATLQSLKIPKKGKITVLIRDNSTIFLQTVTALRSSNLMRE